MKTPYTPDAKGPLNGLRVLDMTRLAAGNMMTHMLADFGAEVIKIERPGKGDDLRRFGEAESWWKVYARSKKSVTLDFRSDDGRAVLDKLIGTADILCENFVPGTLEKWGMGPDDLWRLNPGLIIVRVSGWGQTGPYRTKPGFGSLIEGMSGFAAMTGWADKPPLLPPLALADMVAGLAGFGGVLSAVIARQNGAARGQVVDLSLFEPLFAILGPWAAAYEATGTVPQRKGNSSDVAAPRNLYPTKDGKFIAMSASMQSMWEKLAQAIGRAELVEDPKFRTAQARVQNAAELDEIIAAAMKTRTLDENLDFFESRGVTVGPICDISELIDHPYIRGREVLQDFDYDGMARLPMHQSFPRLSATPGSVRAPAPKLGQHTAEVLAGVGIAETDYRDLAARGIC
ncbi:CaiB/BaiF CoA transferase family protein [Mameliella sediminis]|uniref:CaiB/BaiF CoA transferase family protein n=1 Tax=Mameliella sediminis TaxID=2836866 RepID=UPI001C441C83|nr:CoA transferase [Mameliella sediminis]MBY6115296.1 CoA transferase [Antarctobacter heliothermus]MBY6144639.1 CoA transferase [Mameliella alba]MBV7395753.1 CoA transferase [Mameliella sediminis]MBY6160166.1 CoA transferase [Mameliella alba]MBY6168636.1 CoA transferase [Mameliella alba]